MDAETRLNPAAGSIYFGGNGGSQDSQSAGSTVRPSTPADADAAIEAALQSLAPEDRVLAESQRYCPILSDNRLGVMGVPLKVMIDRARLRGLLGEPLAKLFSFLKGHV